MTSTFSWQNSVSLCPASFCTPRPNMPVTPTFALQSPMMKRTSFLSITNSRSSPKLMCIELVMPSSHLILCQALWKSRRPKTNIKSRCPFHHRELECKSRKSRDTWSNRQVWPWRTKRSRAKTNRVLSREHTDLNKHPLWTTQAKILHMGITRCSTPKSDRLYLLQPKTEKLYGVSKNKTWSWPWLRLWALYCKNQA